MQKDSVIIIGGGVAGLCSAYYLLNEGWKVTIIDKSYLTDNCSYGNAGMLVPSHFVPLAAPGIVSQGIRWLFNKRSPFYIKSSLNLSLIRWGWIFMRHANSNHVEAFAPAIRDLNLFSKSKYKELKNSDGFNFPMENKGVFMLYKSEKAKKEEYETAKMAQDLNISCDILDSDAVYALEPNVKLDVLGGVHYKSDGHINPGKFMKELIRNVEERGATIYRNSKVDKVEVNSGRVNRIFCGSQAFSADKYVWSNGADLDQLARLGDLYIPVLPGKGYSFMTSAFNGNVKIPSLLVDGKVSVTPMGNQVRLAGTMELGVKNHRIRKSKIKGITEAVKRYYPEVEVKLPKNEEVWHGFRPCSPDGVPYLGLLEKLDNVAVAGGAGMMGMSCGPGMGKIISELIAEKPTSIDIRRFKPERFN